MPLEVSPLNESQRHEIAKTLRVWADYHPYRNLPIIELADGSELTPESMALAAAEPDSRRGRLIYRLFAVGLIDDSVEPPETLGQILAGYWRDIELWRSERRR